ncbi:hypothetical protein TUMEXPCC7403_12410 [Tumidithrix helvetica PCC 7403]|uniref:AlbA family DNA-binding domain-containing protein n=1 Tax=Tumidithrix helvetica TaxID=3457545 RepID=UPI003CB07833
MINKQFDLITKEDIDALVTNEVAESRTLEYKDKLLINKGDEKKEFLKDVTAFANASGGDLIFGIQEKIDAEGKTTGIPESAHGLEVNNLDVFKLQLENIILNCVSPRFSFRIQAIHGFKNGSVIIIRIFESWNSPHIITTMTSPFYARNSAGKYPLDITEIRSAFAMSESLPEKIRGFRDVRLSKIMAREAPINLYSKNILVVHLLPIASIRKTINIDLLAVEDKIREAVLITPNPNHPSRSRYNIDGFLKYLDETTKDTPSYVQFFREGAIEAVVSLSPSIKSYGNKRYIEGKELQKNLVFSLKSYVEILKNIEINLPIFVLVSLIGLKGCQIISNLNDLGLNLDKVDRDVLFIPDCLIDNYDESLLSEILRPAFDILWQSSGWKSCPLYD